ncbi:hypothetical protein NKJ84_24060, partial [Mesorhizobium sp. M0048]|uniref:hypothetical protein n=1 Tax=Mesorhizobium sp. M0048 TaxID=2956860 RepID=UPI003335903D
PPSGKPSSPRSRSRPQSVVPTAAEPSPLKICQSSVRLRTHKRSDDLMIAKAMLDKKAPLALSSVLTGFGASGLAEKLYEHFNMPQRR